MLSKKQAKLFFLGGTILFAVIFLGLSFDTVFKQVPTITNADQLTESVIAGRVLWDENNCMGCHTLMGEGAYYAPELTKVSDRLDPAVIKTILTSKVAWAPHGRKMVAYGFSEEEANNLVEFFNWVGKVDLNGFPAKPKKFTTSN